MTSLSSGRGRRPSLPRLLLGGLGVVAAVCWPLLVYALLSRLTADPTGDATSGHVSPWVWALIALGALLIQRLPLPWFPCLTLAVLLVATSLWRGMPIIERLARLKEPDLPAAGVRYTRKVTRVWCGFFVFNASVAAATALYADLATWTLYNGLVSYVLMGLLFCGEWLVRRRLRRADG